MLEQEVVLGIDTSNYTTSVAMVRPDGRILCDNRKLLTVKQGERGLRQSHALFQHMENLPLLLEEAFQTYPGVRVSAVAASAKPRPEEGSYMPVFKAGMNFGRTLSAAFSVPFFAFSHQEGHMEVVRFRSGYNDGTSFLCFQFSGGTCELLRVREGSIEVLGGSKDISFGQVLDRIGVMLGMRFPCGEVLSALAEKSQKGSGDRLSAIPRSGFWIHLSGLETQARRILEKETVETARDEVVEEIFNKIVQCIVDWSSFAAAETGISKILFAGGVSASGYIRRNVSAKLDVMGIGAEFGDAALSSDNAVGIALLGGNEIWRPSR